MNNLLQNWGHIHTAVMGAYGSTPELAFIWPAAVPLALQLPKRLLRAVWYKWIQSLSHQVAFLLLVLELARLRLTQVRLRFCNHSSDCNVDKTSEAKIKPAVVTFPLMQKPQLDFPGSIS